MTKQWQTIFLLFVGFTLNGQTTFLNRKITVDIPNCTLETALNEIAKAANFRFSYDAGLIQDSRQVQLNAKNTPVNALLKEILGNDIRPKEVGNHVILVRSRITSLEKKPYASINVKGLILDASTRLPVANVTVYEVDNKKSAITDKTGSYALRIPTGKKIRSLSYCKSGYADTVIFVKQSADKRVDLLLYPLQGGLSHMTTLTGSIPVNPTDSLALVQWLVPDEAMVNSQNLTVGSSRTFQASVIPYIGTNWKVTGSITNRFSLNLLAGYTGGLQGVELGGLLNITRNNINGLQIGGLANMVGGTGKGWQIAGLCNIGLGKFEGVQVGGLVNYAPDTISGVQIGGLANIATGKIKGVQLAGLTNIVTKSCQGWQVSGLLNLTLGDTRQVQISGLTNYCNNLEGLQLTGLVNIVRRLNSGIQIAGLLNYATTVRGLQLAFINVSNTVERGVPIGFFSYVQKGYHLFEVSGNEIFYANLAFKSGTRTLYNIIQAGIGGDYKLQGSYGVGTIFTLRKKLSMSIDASAGFVYHPTGTVYHGLLLKFNPSIEYKFARHFALFAGPSYNFFLFSKGEPSATPRGLSTYDFYFKSTENASIQMWIGGVLGMRI